MDRRLLIVLLFTWMLWTIFLIRLLGVARGTYLAIAFRQYRIGS